jgi:hypothetical protein
MTFVDTVVECVVTICNLVLMSPFLLFILLLGSLYHSEIDPTLGCLALSGAVVLGAIGRPLWTALLLPFGATTLNLALLLSRWKAAGLWDTGVFVAGHLLVVFGVICGGGWILGQCVSWLVRTIILCVPWLVRHALSAQSYHNHPL